MTYKNNLLTILLVLTWGGSLSYATASEVKVPPGFTLPWNIAPKGSVVEQDFEVNEYRVYRIEFKFALTQELHGAKSPDDEWQQLRRFSGDSSWSLVTKDSANTDHPEVVIPTAKTKEEARSWYNSLKKGEYVYKAMNPGVIVPIHIRIDQLQSDGTFSSHTDKLIDTDKTERAVEEGLVRLIIETRLMPGRYRLVGRTMRETPVPQAITTFLRVTTR